MGKSEVQRCRDQADCGQERKGRGGSIIATTSAAAIRNSTFIAASYPVAKHAVERMVRQAALELVRYQIRVNAIAPGPFITTLESSAMFNVSAWVRAMSRCDTSQRRAAAKAPSCTRRFPASRHDR